MLGGRPLFVLFGSSIVQYSFSNGGWGAALADIYARKVRYACCCIISVLCVFAFLSLPATVVAVRDRDEETDFLSLSLCFSWSVCSWCILSCFNRNLNS
jgi:hypothetical protein